MAAVGELATSVGSRAASRTLVAPRASPIAKCVRRPAKARPPPAPPRAHGPAEHDVVLAHVHGERFQDPAAVRVTLLRGRAVPLPVSATNHVRHGGPIGRRALQNQAWVCSNRGKLPENCGPVDSSLTRYGGRSTSQRK
jgi:hypothetical protein